MYRQEGGAWIHEEARLGEGVVVEPGAVLGPGVVVGDRSWIGPSAVLCRDTTLGVENRVYPGAILGGDPQDIGYGGETTRLEIGDRNSFREGVTIHRATTKADCVTRIGSDNFFMAHAHVGHDSTIEDRCVFANQVLVAGHCHIHYGANISGNVSIAQFCTVGRFAFVGGFSGVRSDVEPFMFHDKRVETPYAVRPLTVNKVGLERNGFDREAIAALRAASRVLFSRETFDIEDVRARFEEQGLLTEHVLELVDFIARKRAGRSGKQLQSPRPRK